MITTRSLIRATNTIGELLALYAVILIAASGLYMAFEGKSLADSLWWAVVTATTTGYGDQYPTTIGGRIVATVLMHATVLFVMPLMIGRIIGTLIEDQHRFTHEEQMQVLSDLAFIRAHIEKEAHARPSAD